MRIPDWVPSGRQAMGWLHLLFLTLEDAGRFHKRRAFEPWRRDDLFAVLLVNARALNSV